MHDEANSRFSKAPKNRQCYKNVNTPVAVSRLAFKIVSVLGLTQEEVNLTLCPIQSSSRKIVCVNRFQIFDFLSWSD